VRRQMIVRVDSDFGLADCVDFGHLHACDNGINIVRFSDYVNIIVRFSDILS
jgi:endonuclease IV